MDGLRGRVARRVLMGGVLLAALVWAGLPARALACSCVAMPIEEHLQWFEALGAEDGVEVRVFEGVALEREEPAMGLGSSSADPVRYRFEVRRSWLGEVPTRVEVATARDSASCGARFEIGQPHLVFVVDRAGEGWTTSLCDPNMPIEQAGEALGLLGEGQAPVAGSGESADGSRGRLPLVVGLGAILLGLLAFVLIERDRQRRIRAAVALEGADDSGAGAS